jgi:hypothetical protein
MSRSEYSNHPCDSFVPLNMFVKDRKISSNPSLSYPESLQKILGNIKTTNSPLTMIFLEQNYQDKKLRIIVMRITLPNSLRAAPQDRATVTPWPNNENTSGRSFM